MTFDYSGEDNNQQAKPPLVQDQIFVLNLQGAMTYEKCLENLAFLADFAECLPTPKFLLDVRQSPYQGTVTSQYLLANGGMARLGYQRHWKTAILKAPDDDTHDFLELVANNAGYRLKIFEDTTNALDWLE